MPGFDRPNFARRSWKEPTTSEKDFAMGLFSRTPNGELEVEAMIVAVPGGLSETTGAGGGQRRWRGQKMRRRHSRTQKTERVGERQQGASAREGFTGTRQTSLDAMTMRQERLPGWAKVRLWLR